MKKIFTLFLALLFVFSLYGCKVKTYETPTLKKFEVSNNACKNLIIFIGDGMGPEQIKAAELIYGETFEFTSWASTYSDTFSYNSFSGEFAEVTDSAAGGTAIATGVVTINGRVGVDKDENSLATILDYAKAMGKSTGVVTTDTIYGATPSDFSAHAIDRSLTDEIISSEICSNVDLFIGEFSSVVDERKEEIEKGGYTYFSSYDLVKNINKAKKAWCQFSFEESNGNVSLKDACEVAINYLSQNKNGYCLMIEAAHIDKNAHNNDLEKMIKAVKSLNTTIDYAKSVAGNNTGIIITADHETGGLLVSKNEYHPSKYNDVYYSFSSTSHSGAYVPVYVYGFNVDFKEFSYFDTNDLVKNSDIFKIELYAITGNK